MPFQRKLLLMIFILLILVLIWPKDQQPTTDEPSVDPHVEVSGEPVMRPVPDTRNPDGSQRPPEDAAAAAEEDVLEALADTPLSEDVAPTGAASVSVPPFGLSESQRRQFVARGLNSPEERILQDLLNQPGLIPQEGVLGGQMAFIPEETYLLNHRWVLATFEDGHLRGQALYEYELTTTGDLIWMLLAQFTD